MRDHEVRLLQLAIVVGPGLRIAVPRVFCSLGIERQAEYTVADSYRQETKSKDPIEWYN